MQDPDQARVVFPEFFAMSFDDAVSAFQARMRGGSL
jgi:hypothetical protein